jgi:hypothetical protein
MRLSGKDAIKVSLHFIGRKPAHPGCTHNAENVPEGFSIFDAENVLECLVQINNSETYYRNLDL